MKAMKITHDLERNLTPGSTYKYKCKRCRQEWKTPPTSRCPGVKVFFSRDPNDCPQQYKTLVELEARGMQPVDKDQPIAAFRTSRQGAWVFLYDETQAVAFSPSKKSVRTKLYHQFYRLTKVWRHQLGIVVAILEGSIVATLAGFSTWSPTAPVVVFFYRYLPEALAIGGVVLLFSFTSVIALLWPAPQHKSQSWRTHQWIFFGAIPVLSVLSNTFFVLLLAVILVRPPWCPSVFCPAPQPYLHPQGSHDDQLEIYFTAIQSVWDVIPGDPTRSVPDQHSESIGALKTDGQTSSPLYHLVLGLHSLQEGRFGMTIEKIELVVQEVSPIPRPLNVWNKLYLIDYENPDQYQAAYTGQEAGTMLPAEYLRFKNGFVHLNPGETNPIDIHLISRVEADIQFSVQVLYRVDNESRWHLLSLSLPSPFEVVFAEASSWHLYRLQGEHFVANS